MSKDSLVQGNISTNKLGVLRPLIFGIILFLLSLTLWVGSDDSYAAMNPGFQSIGGAAGPAMVGMMIINGSLNYVYLLALFTTFLSFALFWFINLKHRAEINRTLTSSIAE